MLVGSSSVMFEFGVELGLTLGVGGAKPEIYIENIWRVLVKCYNFL
jgi:hypothetical protein